MARLLLQPDHLDLRMVADMSEPERKNHIFNDEETRLWVKFHVGVAIYLVVACSALAIYKLFIEH